MPSVKQVLEQYEKDPGAIFGQLLVAVERLHGRVEVLEEIIINMETAECSEH